MSGRTVIFVVYKQFGIERAVVCLNPYFYLVFYQFDVLATLATGHSALHVLYLVWNSVFFRSCQSVRKFLTVVFGTVHK